MGVVGVFLPNVELKWEVARETRKNQNLEQKIESLHHDLDQTRTEAWQAQQELTIERGANQTRQLRYQTLEAETQTTHALNQTLYAENQQLLTQHQQAQQTYTEQEESTQLQLDELQIERQTLQAHCLDLEQRLSQPFSQPNHQHVLNSLQQESELRQLLSPEDTNDFEYRSAATRIYTPQTDTPLEQELEQAFLSSLEKTQKSKLYQHVTLTIADKLFTENCPLTAASLYNTLLKYFTSESYQPASPQETKYTNIKETRDRLTTIIKTNPQYAPAVFEIAHLNLQNQHYNLAEELGIALATATNNSEYWQFIGDVITQSPTANLPKRQTWAQQCYQKAGIIQPSN